MPPSAPCVSMGCEQAPNWDPAGIGSTALIRRRKNAVKVGSRSAPTGTLPVGHLLWQDQCVAAAFGRDPSSELVHMLGDQMPKNVGGFAINVVLKGPAT